MKIQLLVGLAAALVLVGCGSKDPDQNPDLATHAPPPGPNANLHPQVAVGKNIPTPPMMGAAPGAAPSGAPGPAAKPSGG